MSYTAARAPLGALITRVGKVINVDVFASGDTAAPVREGDRALVVSSSQAAKPTIAALWEVRADEVLHAAEIVSQSRWFQVKRLRILTDRPDLARLVLLSFKEREKLIDKSAADLASLSVSQVDTLRARRALLPAEMTPVQRSALQRLAELMYVDQGDIVAPEAMSLDGTYVSLALTQESTTHSIQPELRVMLPTLDGGETLTVSIPVSDQLRLPGAPAQPGFRAPVPIEGVLASRWSDGLPKCKDLERDSRLQNKVRPNLTTVAGAVSTVAKEAHVSLVISTALLHWPVHAGADTGNAAGLLRAIERTTGGNWQRVGETYALSPQPVVERMASLESTPRKRWLDTFLVTAMASLPGNLREELRQKRTLTAQVLPARAKRLLRFAAAAAFASRRGVSLEALSLERLEVRLFDQDRAAGSASRVELVVPLSDGGTWVATQVPYR